MTATMVLDDREYAIAAAVFYAAIFEYPLTLEQLRETLIESVQTSAEVLSAYHGSAALQAIVDYRDGFFFPRGRDAFVEERRRREERSRALLHRKRFLLRCICAIPFVEMVALSGSIAHLNLVRDGDLDLFIVTRGRRAWMVTLAVVVLAKVLRSRRLVCANFTVADSELACQQKDLFAANQIIHLKPLVGVETYRRLLAANPFVYRFYPNLDRSNLSPAVIERSAIVERTKALVETMLAWPSIVLERMCRAVYRRHLLRRAPSWQSPEQVCLGLDCVKLHTRSHRRSVLDRFERGIEDALREAEMATFRPRRRASLP